MDRGTVRNMYGFMPKLICEVSAFGWFYYKENLGDISKHVAEICLLHWLSFFAGKKQNFRSRDYSPQVPDYLDFRIIGRRIKGIFL
jgi:hypothetical protein